MLLVACFTLGSVAVAEEIESSDDIRKDVRELLALMGGDGEIGLNAMEQIIDSFRQCMPWAPSEYWDNFVE